jgi:hypothetical protein
MSSDKSQKYKSFRDAFLSCHNTLGKEVGNPKWLFVKLQLSDYF